MAFRRVDWETTIEAGIFWDSEFRDRSSVCRYGNEEMAAPGTGPLRCLPPKLSSITRPSALHVTPAQFVEELVQTTPAAIPEYHEDRLTLMFLVPAAAKLSSIAESATTSLL